MGLNLFLSAAKKVEQNKAKTLASMGLKTHFARVAIKTHFAGVAIKSFLSFIQKAEQNI
jgi:hypothetical protein